MIDAQKTNVLRNLRSVDIDRLLVERKYINFVKAAWDLVEPARPFVRSWNVDAVCEHVEAVIKGQLTRLIINVPPNTSKSMTCSVLATPYAWTQIPQKKFIYATFDDKLARRDSLRAKNLIKSPWYQARWGDVVKINPNLQDTGEKYYTTEGGFRQITTPGGSVTGEHADIQLVDDPIKPADTVGTRGVNMTDLNRINEWWQFTMASRLVDFDNSARIIIMQRLHENDLAGYALAEMGGYEHLMLPMEYEPERKCYTSIGFEDPRTEAGELLCPERHSAEAVEKLKKDLGPRGARAQLQQDPITLKGDIFKRDKVRFYKQLPEFWDVACQSWDCTFKEVGTSFVVGQVWCRKGPDYYLMDRVRDRWSFSQTCAQIQMLTVRWPKVVKKLIEAKANGDAIVDALKKEMSGLELVEPKGGKDARANSIEPLWTAGNVWLPHPSTCDWVEEYLDFMVKFPNGRFDDDIDSTSQALANLSNNALAKLKAAMLGSR